MAEGVAEAESPAEELAEEPAEQEAVADEEAVGPPAVVSLRRRVSRVLRVALTTFSLVLVWAALVLPDRTDKLGFTAFLRIPVELVVLVGLSLVLPKWTRRVVSLLFGAVLGLLVILKILNMGFYLELDRPFNPVVDGGSFGPAIGVLRDSVGRGRANALVAGALVLFGLFVVLLALASARVAGSAARHRPVALRAFGTFGVGWLVCALFSVNLVAGTSLASAGAAELAAGEVQTVRTSLHDQQVFAATLASRDPAARIRGSYLLSGLRGKDVLVTFAESYGQVAVQGTPFSRGVDDVLKKGTATLRAAGFWSRSAFLSSPTFGGISWLAHSTLQSGLWINSQQRYVQVLGSDRLTLSSEFKRAGWQTVSDVPSDVGTWPQGQAFYQFDKMYNSQNVGYQGPRFSYARIPDEYTLSTFQRLELTPGHAPVMGEIDLDSSHTPWTPIPRYLPWGQIGNGSVYDNLPPVGGRPTDVWQSAAAVQHMYGLSVQYSMRSLVSFVTHSQDKNLVLIVLGDHQPSTTVSGFNASHDVPITIVAHDPSVLSQISSWHWEPGMLPHPNAPTWPMDAFRNRLLNAFSSPTD